MPLAGKLTAGGVGTVTIGLAAFVAQVGPSQAYGNFCGWTGELVCAAPTAEKQQVIDMPNSIAKGGEKQASAAAPEAPAPAAVSPIKLSLEPILKADNSSSSEFRLLGLMQARITNEGTAPAHVAWGNLYRGSEVILDDGTVLRPGPASDMKPKGVDDCGASALDACWERYSSGFTIIAPGQTISAYAYYSDYVPANTRATAAAVKTASFSARLYVVVPDTKFRQAQPIDFVGVPAKNTIG